MYNNIIYGQLIILSALAVILIVVYLWFRHRERLKMIKQGMQVSNPESLEYLKQTSLRNGIFLISMGFGVLFTRVLSIYFPFLSNLISYVGIFSITGGIGMLIYYRINLKDD